MTAARLALGVVGLILVTTAVGCGGSDEPGSDPPTQPPETTSATPTEESTPTYVVVPPDVTLDEPGSRFELKETAVAGWLPRQDLVGVVDVAVARIEATTLKASFGDYDLDDQSAGATPYYVRTTATNVGSTDLGGRQLPFYVVSSDGSLVAPTGIEQDFAECPDSLLPAIFAPGDEAKSCLIFLVPEGGTLESVMFRPPEGVVPLLWTGDVKPVKDERRRGRR
ncbi:MAG: hypothetical protein WB767_02940 [Nocardioides sp.]